MATIPRFLSASLRMTSMFLRSLIPLDTNRSRFERRGSETPWMSRVIAFCHASSPFASSTSWSALNLGRNACVVAVTRVMRDSFRFVEREYLLPRRRTSLASGVNLSARIPNGLLKLRRVDPNFCLRGRLLGVRLGFGFASRLGHRE